MNAPGPTGQCPVCQARFRGTNVCSRCGADLERLMRITAMSWQLREAARRAIEAGDHGRACRLALHAERVQQTPCGGSLLVLAKWLEATAR